VRECYNIFS